MQRTAKTISRVVLGLTLGTGLGISVQSAQVMAAPQDGDRPALRDGNERGPRGPRDGDRPGGRDGRPGGDRGGAERGPGGPGGPGGRVGPGRGGPEMMMRMPIIAALDADHDGVISSKEIKNASAALATLDKNKDGDLVLSELVPDFGGRGRGGAGGPGFERPGGQGFGGQGFGGRGPGGERGPGGDRGPGGRGPGSDRGRPDMERGDGAAARGGAGEGRGRGNPEEMLARLMQQDKDGDGMLTKEELPGFMSRMMERADTDGDSKLSREELESAMSKMRRGGGGAGGRGGAGNRGGDRGGSGDAAGGEKPRRPPAE